MRFWRLLRLLRFLRLLRMCGLMLVEFYEKSSCYVQNSTVICVIAEEVNLS